MSEPEDVWVVVDGAGQPCLAHIIHRGRPGSLAHGEVPEVPQGLDPEFGPYRSQAYRLVPAAVGDERHG